ncbi:lyase family protein [Nocardiopsis potens]|uniref:lyase family protein n=1 Tax=Nocardiopsis potens TaxID=1246458 RepID=UPI0003460AB1|nr:lyase family protein [Nocardiopsis potens]
MSGLFSGMFGRGPAAAETGGEAWLRAMLDAEAALARALARTGLAAPEHAEAITAACRDRRFDAEELGRAAAASANPVVPLVKAVTAAVGGDAARHVHQGATSQDIMDTAAMLVARRAGAAAAAEARAAADGLAELAERHRGSVMAGRTLLQQALPTTFGLVAAGWMAALDDAAAAVLAETGERARAQFGGAAGTLASLGDRGPAVAAAFADELGLARPLPPWHTDRGPVVSAAGALARLSGAAGKAAGDIALLAQTEVAEVAEAGGAGVGGSSTMPHKRNPVAAVSAVACAEQAPGLAATLLAAQIHQPHQRAAGAWQAEWEPLDRLLRSTGSAVSWLAESVRRLRPDPERMRRNLELTGGFPLAERVATDLAPQLGRLPAHELVQRACAEAAAGDGDLAAALTAHLDGLRTGEEIAALLDPADYLGAASALIDAALDRHRTIGPR